jgi:hypothetical protein
MNESAVTVTDAGKVADAEAEAAREPGDWQALASAVGQALHGLRIPAAVKVGPDGGGFAIVFRTRGLSKAFAALAEALRGLADEGFEPDEQADRRAGKVGKERRRR